MTHMDITDDEYSLLYQVLTFTLDSLDEDDDRWETTLSLLNKLEG